MSLGLTPSSLLLLLLGGAALLLYFAGRFAMGQIPPRADGSGTRAWLAAMPVLIVSLVTVALDRAAIGLHLPVACAAAALTFGLGVVMTGREMPKGTTDGAAPAGTRSWPLVVPGVALVLIAAMGGTLAPWVLAIVALFGGLALAGWQPDRFVATDHAMPPTKREQRLTPGLAIAVWTGAAIAGGVAAGMAVAGLPALEQVRQTPADALATVFLLAPAIVVPMCFELLPPCRPIGWAASVSALSRFAVTCLCVVLPIVALAASARPAVANYFGLATARKIVTPPTTTPAEPSLFPTSQGAPTSGPTTTPTTAAMPKLEPTTLRPIGLPAVPQRIDLFVVAGASLMLLPIASGRLRPGKREAFALIGIYLAYLVLVMAMVVR